MAKIEQYKCDGCGKVKGESNHWWVVGLMTGKPSVEAQIVIVQLRSTLSSGYRLYDFCGQECALKFIAQEMNNKG